MQSLRTKALYLLVVSAFSTSSAICEQGNVEPLHDALQAQGGEQRLRAIRNVRWTLAGYRDEVEEPERPEGPYVAEFDSTSEIHDFQRRRFLSLTDARVYPVFSFTRGSLAHSERQEDCRFHRSSLESHTSVWRSAQSASCSRRWMQLMFF